MTDITPLFPTLFTTVVVFGNLATRSFHEGETDDDKLNDLGSVETFTFKTEAEQKAFLTGLDAANGWLDYAVKETTQGQSSLPIAVIFNQLDPNGDWTDEMYEIFDTEAEATRIFHDMVGSNAKGFSNPRIVHVQGVIPPPEGQTWGEQQ